MQRLACAARISMARKRITLVLDWDGTITRKDTMFAMAEIASARDQRLGIDTSPAKQWNNFGEAYMDDYTAHEAHYSPKAESRLDQDSESAWLKTFATVEAQSVSRVEESGFFRGVKTEDVVAAAKSTSLSGTVALRPGWEKLFARARQFDLNLSILSVNWSETFIRASLKAAADNVEHHKRDALHRQIDTLEIHTNEIDGLDAPEGSSGHLSSDSRPSIRTSADKLQHFKRLPDYMNVYVGDSATDYDCLLAADVGLCMRDEPLGSSQQALASALGRTGHHVQHISNVALSNAEDAQTPLLLCVEDFLELGRFLLGDT
jgi:2-hydroxy-3-keto-5-methylthiopentenyl-1-phosphate phosphatase